MFKRKIFISLLVVLTILAACSNKDEADTDKQASKEKAEEESVAVEKDRSNVEITLPASMFEGQDVEESIASAKAEGISEVIENDDGSFTYKMPKSVYDKMLKNLEENVHQTIDATIKDENYASIQDVTSNRDFTKFTVVVSDQKSYENSFDGFASIGVGLSGLYYQLFSGVKSEDAKVTVSVKDESTGKVFHKAVYPDDLDEEEQD